ncbi:hypothetical protein BGZ67_000712 [Mortierella alpina]|nr:hypothetical protein BGZ67_000712 [Mortierella alpina]
MTDQELKCNVLTCRVKLDALGKACVTTCSHIFCVTCATRAFDVALVCPACETSLTKQDDIVFVELNPSQEYRSSILSGLSPEVIMEICTRAISFWTYQTSQEAKFQEMAQRTLEDKLSLVEKQLQRLTREVNVELNGFRDTVSGLQEELEQERRKSADLSGQLEEKMRQLSKVQAQYDRQKRRPLFTDTLLQTHTQALQEHPAMPLLSGNPYHHYQVMPVALEPSLPYDRVNKHVFFESIDPVAISRQWVVDKDNKNNKDSKGSKDSKDSKDIKDNQERRKSPHLLPAHTI